MFKAELSNANLTSADMTGTSIEGAVLRDAVLKDAVLQSAYISDTVRILCPSISDTVGCALMMRRANLTLLWLRIMHSFSFLWICRKIVYAADITGADFTDALISPEITIAKLCARPDATGTNSKTGANTRESLMCPD